MRVTRRSLSAASLSLAAAALIFAACTDSDSNPVGPSAGPPIQPPQSPDPIALIECKGSVVKATLSCGEPSPTGPARNLIPNGAWLGSQHVNVSLISSNIDNQTTPGIFAFDVKMVNLIEQAIGTTDGTTADPYGSRVFFYDGVHTTLGTGTITVNNPTAMGMFTDVNQPYFQYTGVLQPNDTTPTMQWKLQFDPTVQEFSFLLFVYTPVQYPQGYITITPNPTTIDVTGKDTLVGVVKNKLGSPTGASITSWVSSDTMKVKVVQIGPNSAEVTGVGLGSATITASTASGMAAPYGQRTGTSTVIVNNTPVTNPDTFPAFENVTITRPVAKGLLRKWSDPDGDPVTVVAGTFTTPFNGTAVVSADGSFSYLSAPGFNGVDTLHFQVQDSLHTVNAVALVPVTNTHVWYVRPAFVGTSDGRDSHPFTTITAAQAVAVAGDSILVQANGANQVTDAAVLKSNQALLGQGIPASIVYTTADAVGVTVLAAGSAPGLTRVTAGPAVTLNSAGTGNTIRGVGITAANGAAILGTTFGTLTASDLGVNPAGPALDLTTGTLAASFTLLSSTGSATTGLHLSGVGGTLSAAGGAIQNATGTAFDIVGGTLTFSYPGAIDNTAGRVVSITGVTGGAITLTGNITDSGTGILVTGNTGGTIAFDGASKSLGTGTSAAVTVTSNTGATVSFGGGGLVINTTSGAGFTASGGGTVSVTGAGNTVATGTGTAVSLNGVSTGASGVSLLSVSANGAPSGISLTSVTGNGVQVTGDGATGGSGGAIQNTTGHSVSLSTLTGTPVLLKFINVTGAGASGNAGIFASAADSVVATSVSVAATGGPALSFSGSHLSGTFTSLSSSGSASSGVILTNGVGSFTAAGGSISNATGTGFAVSGGSQSATYSGGITQTANNASLVAVSGGHTGTLTFNTGTLQATTGNGLQFNNAGGSYAFNGTTTLNGGDAGVDVLAGSGGTFAFAAGTAITSPTGQALLVDASAPTLTFAGTINTGPAAGRPVQVQGTTGGSVDVSGSVTSTGLGILVQNNTGGSTTFSGSKSLTTGANAAVTLTTNAGHAVAFTGGGLAITTTTGIGFGATGSGTFTVTGAGNNIGTGAGAAISLANVTVGAAGMVLGTVSSSGTPNAVSLTSVTGTGPITTTGGTLTGVAAGATFLVSGGSANVTWSGGITQGANNALLSVSGGHTGTLTFQTGTLQATSGTGLQFSNADGTYNLNGTTTLNGGDAGIDVLAGSAGAFTFTSGTAITNPTGIALNVSNGSSATGVSYAGSIATNASRAVVVEGVSSGTVTVTGSVTSTGTGVLVQNNTGGTMTFSGSTKTLNTGANAAVTLTSNTGASVLFSGGNLDVDTNGAGTAFNASGGGTLQITGANNTINAVNGTALVVNGLTIGASGLSFVRIDATNGANGIFLKDTGTQGMQVIGTGSAGSGGTLSGTTGGDGATAGNGVYLENARNVSLSFMNSSNHGNNGLFGTGVRGMTLTSMTFNGNQGSSNSGTFEESAIHLVNVGGAVSITNSTISGGAYDNVRVLNNTGTAPTVDSLVFTGNTLGTMQGSAVDVRNHSVTMQFVDGTADVRIRKNDVNFWWGTGIHVLFQSTASGNVAVTGNNVTQANVNPAPGAAGIVVDGGNIRYDIVSDTVVGATGAAIAVDEASNVSSTFHGTIANNVIGTTGVVNSGSSQGSGISVVHLGAGTSTHAITNNVIRQINGIQAILLQAGDASGSGGNGTFNATVTGNDIQEAGSTLNSGRSAIILTSGTASGDGHLICADIGGAGGLKNNIANFNTASAGNTNRIRPNQRFSTTARMPGYGGANNDNAAVGTYLLGRNTATQVVASNSVATGGGGYVNTPGGAACPQP